MGSHCFKFVEGTCGKHKVRHTKLFSSISMTAAHGVLLFYYVCMQPAGGTVTAGNSSPLTDGAAALVLCSRKAAQEHGLPILAVIRSQADANQAPEWCVLACCALLAAAKGACQLGTQSRMAAVAGAFSPVRLP